MERILGILLLTVLIAGCDGGGNNFDCTQFGDFPRTDCLAEDMSDLCMDFSCDTDPATTVLALFQSCSAVDCSTFDCGNTIFEELERSEDGAITSQVFVDDQDLGLAECSFFQR